MMEKTSEEEAVIRAATDLEKYYKRNEKGYELLVPAGLNKRITTVLDAVTSMQAAREAKGE